jgi:hypothetical protein
MCVAASRAKCGAYYFGDTSMLMQPRKKRHSSCWKLFIESMHSRGLVGDEVWPADYPRQPRAKLSFLPELHPPHLCTVQIKLKCPIHSESIGCCRTSKEVSSWRCEAVCG